MDKNNSLIPQKSNQSVLERIISAKDSMIESIIERIDPKRGHDAGHIELSTLTPEERKQCFIKFSEGNESLLGLLTTAYEHGIESMFCCAGHSIYDSGYVVFKVTDENVGQLKQIGKAISHEGIVTNFENHYLAGKRVCFREFEPKNKNWFQKVEKTLRSLPEAEIEPAKYYHEEMIESYRPMSFTLRKSLIKILTKMHSGGQLKDTKNNRELLEPNKTVQSVEFENQDDKTAEFRESMASSIKRYPKVFTTNNW